MTPLPAPLSSSTDTDLQHGQAAPPARTIENSFAEVGSMCETVEADTWSKLGSVQSTSSACILPQFGSRQATEIAWQTPQKAPVLLGTARTTQAMGADPMFGTPKRQINGVYQDAGSTRKDIFLTPMQAMDNSPFGKELLPMACDTNLDGAESDPFSRWTVQQTPSKREQSLGPGHVMVGEDWHGWTIHTSVDGELFYYHEETQTSQWRTPRELLCILGDWVEALDDSGNTYFGNDLLNMSCWTDPRCTANIFQAAYEGDMFFLQLYVYGKGNLDVVDSSGCAALHYACASSTEGVAAFLLEHGAHPDRLDLSLARPLHWACRYSHSEAARLLLEARADPDRQDQHGDAPLHLAAGVDCTGALQWLINARASSNKQTWKQGSLQTPMQVAVAACAHRATAMLRDYDQEMLWQVGQCTGQTFQPREECLGKAPEEQKTTFKCRSRDRPQPVITRPSSCPPASQAEDETPSPVKVVLHGVAKPLLRGVQWLTNRMTPVDSKRMQCYELGHGAPVLSSSTFSRFIAAIPRSALEQVVHDEQSFQDPPGFDNFAGLQISN